MKPYFLDMHTASKAYLPNLPGLGALEIPVEKANEDDNSQTQIPALVCPYNLEGISLQYRPCRVVIIDSHPKWEELTLSLLAQVSEEEMGVIWWMWKRKLSLWKDALWVHHQIQPDIGESLTMCRSRCSNLPLQADQSGYIYCDVSGLSADTCLQQHLLAKPFPVLPSKSIFASFQLSPYACQDNWPYI